MKSNAMAVWNFLGKHSNKHKFSLIDCGPTVPACLSSIRHQAINLNIAGPLGPNINEILIEMQNVSSTKIYLEIMSAKW